MVVSQPHLSGSGGGPPSESYLLLVTRLEEAGAAEAGVVPTLPHATSNRDTPDAWNALQPKPSLPEADGETRSGTGESDLEADWCTIAIEPPMTPTDYMLALFQELERLLPAGSSQTSHAITWTRVQNDAGAERDALVVLRNVGDCLFPYTTTTDQLTSDPIETARRLAPAIEAAMEREPDRLYTFKS